MTLADPMVKATMDIFPGAEVRGVDLKNIDASQFTALERAWHGHQVILVRGQTLGDHDLIAFSRRFGDLDWAPIQETGRRFAASHPDWTIVQFPPLTLGADELKDRIVIVGTSARGLVDVRATPTREDLPGAEIHASLISGALDNAMKSRPAETLAIAVLTILLVGVPLAVLLPRLSALSATLVVAVVSVLVIGVNGWAWQAHNLVLPLAGPLVMLTGLYFLDVVWGFFGETRPRQLMTSLFGTYVPKEIVAEMAEHPDEYSMHGQSLDMTVLFADIRDFTSIAETRTPQDLKDLINTYFTKMTVCIQDKRGTVDKYIGDAIMAFWGAPVRDADHARRALECGGAQRSGDLLRLDHPAHRRGLHPRREANPAARFRCVQA